MHCLPNPEIPGTPHISINRALIKHTRCVLWETQCNSSIHVPKPLLHTHLPRACWVPAPAGGTEGALGKSTVKAMSPRPVCAHWVNRKQTEVTDCNTDQCPPPRKLEKGVGDHEKHEDLWKQYNLK